MTDPRIAAYRNAVRKMIRGEPLASLPVHPEDDLSRLGNDLLTLAQQIHQDSHDAQRRLDLLTTLHGCTTVNDALNSLFDRLQDQLPYDQMGFSVRQHDNTFRERWVRSKNGESAAGRWGLIPLSSEDEISLTKADRPIVINDLPNYLACHSDADPTRRLTRDKIGSLVATPLHGQEELLGVLTIYSHEPSRYGSEHADYLEQIKRPIADVLERCHLYEKMLRANEKLVQQIDEQKHIEAALRESETKQEGAIRELQRLATMDGLTGIANRRAFDEKLSREWNRAVRNKRDLSLVLLDVDHFKMYNDTYGHLAGDDCLRSIATKLGQLVRRSSDMVARYGGEEFALLLPETGAENSRELAQRVCVEIEKLAIPHSSSPVSDFVTVSCGTTTFQPTWNDSMDEFVGEADLALYQAKQSGRNRAENRYRVAPPVASPLD